MSDRQSRARARTRAQAWLAGCVTMLAWASACNRASEPSDQHAPAAAAQVAERDPTVGYDLRRLRPRNGETLEAMFDRVRVQAETEGKRVAVLFSADWCEPCRALELELGNRHPASTIGHVRVLELKEEDWLAATRIDEYNGLRARWDKTLNTYPLLIVLDANGKKQEEMREALDRFEKMGVEATVARWFEGLRA